MGIFFILHTNILRDGNSTLFVWDSHHGRNSRNKRILGTLCSSLFERKMPLSALTLKPKHHPKTCQGPTRALDAPSQNPSSSSCPWCPQRGLHLPALHRVGWCCQRQPRSSRALDFQPLCPCPGQTQPRSRPERGWHRRCGRC